MASGRWPKVPPELGRYATAGIEFVIVFCIFLGGGIWLDRRLGTGLVFTLAGLAVGFVAAVYRMIRIQRRFPGDDDSQPRA